MTFSRQPVTPAASSARHDRLNCSMPPGCLTAIACCEAIRTSFPGGMQQRAVIAQALATGAEFLIADEPTSALDKTIGRQVLDVLKALVDEMEPDDPHDNPRHGCGRLRVFAGERALFRHDCRRGRNAGTPGKSETSLHPSAAGRPAGQGHDRTPSGRHRRPASKAGHGIRRMPLLRAMFGCNAFVRRTGATPRETKLIAIGHVTLRPSILEPVLEVSDLVVRYGRSSIFADRPEPAADGISFALYPRKTLGVVGESGSGKSTVLRAILRLVPVESGDVCYNGSDWLNIPVREMRPLRARIGVVMQNPFLSLSPRLTVAEILAEPLLAQGGISRSEMTRRSARNLSDCGLRSEIMGSRAAELSGGQAQRVAFARALALEPDLMILMSRLRPWMFRSKPRF